MADWKIDESGQAKSWAAFLVGVIALVLAVGHEAITFVLDREEQQARIEARLTLPKTADLFDVTHARLFVQEGRFVVFSDGRVLAPFEGRYRVDVRSADTNRHAWTPDWSTWIQYERNPAAPVRYRQPETIEWWSGRDDASRILKQSQAWIMRTCWQARVNDPVLGLTELDPVCVSDDSSGRVQMKIKEMQAEIDDLKADAD
jgi:hypothetical protein